jgi:hypothetical protein
VCHHWALCSFAEVRNHVDAANANQRCLLAFCFLQRKKRVKGGPKGQGGKSFTTESVPCDSFFNIFDPPQVCVYVCTCMCTRAYVCKIGFVSLLSPPNTHLL